MADRQRPKATQVKEVDWSLPNLIKAVNFNLKFRRNRRVYEDKPKARANVSQPPKEPGGVEAAYQDVENTRHALIAGMTNWQRNQWARAGYKNKHVRKFAEMKRPNRKVA